MSDAPNPTEHLPFRKLPMVVYGDQNRKFSALSGDNVLVYWPHGFGDWVFLSHLLPALDRNNRYWVTRVGDDTVSLMEGSPCATPLYTGIQSPHCDDGGRFGMRHFGVNTEIADGETQELRLPVPLYDAIVKNRIEVMLFTPFPETWGHSNPPFHTKCRNSIRLLAPARVLEGDELRAPLAHSLSFSVAPWITRWIEAKLSAQSGLSRMKLCLIGRNGYTALGKNWGHLWREDMPEGRQREGEECRDFMRLMLKRDPNWLFLVLEDRLFSGNDTVRSRELHALSYAELFGEVDRATIPFGMIMKALVSLADLAVGVPAGPFHLCMARADLPTVGIWIEHFPSWYDEPKSASVHLVGQSCRERFSQRPGSFLRNGKLEYNVIWSDTRVIHGEQVMAAVEQLCGTSVR